MRGGVKGAIRMLWERRERAITGLLNSIRIPWPRFRRWWPGLEKARYYLITANQKIGKSKLADYLFVYEPLFYVLENIEKVRLKVLYFSLEMSKTEKYYEFLCHLLFRLDGIRISPVELKSTDSDNPVDESILELLESDKYQKYIDAYNERVIYITDEKNPTGIFKYCEAYALNHGKVVYKNEQRKDPVTGKPITKRVFDYYIPEDPEEYVFVIQDNASNLLNEQGMDLMNTITRLSKYNMDLRDKYLMSPVLIQHQNQAQEGIENIKLDRMAPSANGLADSKTTIRDINTAIGLYSPYKFGVREYEGYDITRFRNRIRFLQIIEDRDNGAGGQTCPLFFDGAVSTFSELPLASDKAGISQVYDYMDSINPTRINATYFMRAFNIISSSVNKVLKRAG